MISRWPQYDPALEFAKEAADFEMVMAAIKAIRIARSNADVPPSRKATVYLKSEHAQQFLDAAPFIERLAFASSVVAVEEDFSIEHAVHVVTDDARILLPMDELIDKEKELARLEREKAGCEKEIKSFEGKLANENFVAKAPAHVVEAERAKLQKLRERYEKILESIAAMK